MPQCKPIQVGPDGLWWCSGCYRSAPDRFAGECPGLPKANHIARRHGRRQIIGSIRLQYRLGTATQPKRAAAGRVRRCFRCVHLIQYCCERFAGTCGARRMAWIEAITRKPGDSWCPLLAEEAAE